MIPRGRVGFQLKRPPLKIPREVTGWDKNEVTLLVLYRCGSVDLELRDRIVQVAGVEPPLIRPMCLDGVAFAKEINRGVTS